MPVGPREMLQSYRCTFSQCISCACFVHVIRHHKRALVIHFVVRNVLDLSSCDPFVSSNWKIEAYGLRQSNPDRVSRDCGLRYRLIDALATPTGIPWLPAMISAVALQRRSPEMTLLTAPATPANRPQPLTAIALTFRASVSAP